MVARPVRYGPVRQKKTFLIWMSRLAGGLKDLSGSSRSRVGGGEGTERTNQLTKPAAELKMSVWNGTVGTYEGLILVFPVERRFRHEPSFRGPG